MIGRFFKTIASVAALGIGLATAGCDNINVAVGDGDSVPLSELDMSGAAPTKLVLASRDRVVLNEGSKLAIKVSGDPDAIAALRFNLGEDSLGIMREKGSKAEGKALVSVTMPAPREIVLAGSGEVDAPVLAEKAKVNMAGSGTVRVAKVAAASLAVNVMGSGKLEAAGAAEKLDFNVAGSGQLAARKLKVERAEINVAGSGGGEFASDGKVTANVAGSGEVTVHGRARCRISALGSGKLHCKYASGDWGEDEAPKDPKAPLAPPAPKAPDAPDAGN